MSQQILKILENIKNQNSKYNQWKNKKLFQLVCRKDFLLFAYQNLKNNSRSMTSGISDNYDDLYFEKLSQLLKTQKFNFIQINKSKIVQEAIKIILESIYENSFSDSSHCFRPNKSCHTALNDIRYKWNSSDWFITFDIKDFFNNTDIRLLISILEKKISDDRFLQLINKFLKKDLYYLSFRKQNSIAETPIGMSLGPILSNIYLNELDKYIDTLSETIKFGERKLENNEYRKLRSITDYNKYIKEWNKFVLSGKLTTVRQTDSFIRLKYIRYADKLIVSLYGSKKTAENISNLIANKINDLKLELIQPPQIIDSYKSIPFLGIEFSVRKPSKVFIIKKKNNKLQKRRIPSGQINIKCNITKLVNKLYQYGYCNKKGFPLAMNKWINYDVENIINRYNIILTKLINYYKPVDNFYNFRRIQYILQYSLGKTLAAKFKTSLPKIFAKYGQSFKINKMQFNLLKSFTTMSKWTNVDDFTIDFYTTLQNQKFLKEKKCSFCGNDKNIVFHHKFKLNRNSKKLTWDQFSGAINRKQIPVCRLCHGKIHSGKLQ